MRCSAAHPSLFMTGNATDLSQQCKILFFHLWSRSEWNPPEGLGLGNGCLWFLSMKDDPVRRLKSATVLIGMRITLAKSLSQTHSGC